MNCGRTDAQWPTFVPLGQKRFGTGFSATGVATGIKRPRKTCSKPLISNEFPDQMPNETKQTRPATCLVAGLITQKSLVQIQPPQPRNKKALENESLFSLRAGCCRPCQMGFDVNALTSTPRSFSFFAYESLRFAALSAVSTAA